MSLYARIKAIADNKIVCRCGNVDWEQFLYIDGGDKSCIGACKKCGCIYEYNPVTGLWIFKADPKEG